MRKMENGNGNNEMMRRESPFHDRSCYDIALTNPSGKREEGL